MLFFLRKLVEAIFMPVGFSGLLIILGIVLRRRWLAAFGVGILLLFATPVVSRLMMEPLERVYPPETVDAAPKADAIVVLSGGIVRGRSRAGVQWGDSANRYFTGFDLAVAGKASFLVLSAGVRPPPNSPGQGATLRQVAIRRGFPPDRIIVTPYVNTTEEEARAVSSIPGIHSILLVTSAFHMPRAAMLFRARGLQVSPFPTDQRVLGPVRFSDLSIIPDSSPLHDSEMAIREYYGLAVYRTIFFVRPGGF
jgi:uncharacterized SAM-binding protein YcdF (DUF218 family)